ncbi:hypothetical protein BDW59DRAFT_156051 [Aspergillus cavernicola]|uniref:Uncharacterized protein n=1 Tax=Aspergillus cavernicola TaxID=176166 RepID=A0ABR4J5G9_9EURO
MHRFPFSQQSQELTTLARFQLAKFSYTTNSNNYRGPLTWSHVFGNGDIVGEFERHTMSPPGRILFKVLCNNETLEEIGITDLLKEHDNSLKAPPNQDNWKKPVFAVVVKLPCLAVKYPLRNTCIRRFQIKFSSDRDYYSALAILSEINCPFSDSNTSSAQPMRRSTSCLSNLGSTGPTTGAQDGLSRTTGTPRSSSSMIPPPYPFRSAPVYSLPSSSSSSTTLYGANRPFSSSTTSTPLTNKNPNQPQFQRPSTTTCYTGFHDTQDLDENLPPTRELPFPKPATKKPRLTLKPNPADAAASSKASSTDTPTKAKIKRSIPTPKNQNIPTQPSSPSRTQANTNTANTTTTPTSTAPTQVTPIEPTSFLPAPADLAQYISNPTKERTAILENWVCAHLEDDNFAQLCVDVEGAWVRLFLGK